METLYLSHPESPMNNANQRNGSFVNRQTDKNTRKNKSQIGYRPSLPTKNSHISAHLSPLAYLSFTQILYFSSPFIRFFSFDAFFILPFIMKAIFLFLMYTVVYVICFNKIFFSQQLVIEMENLTGEILSIIISAINGVKFSSPLLSCCCFAFFFSTQKYIIIERNT